MMTPFFINGGLQCTTMLYGLLLSNKMFDGGVPGAENLIILL